MTEAGKFQMCLVILAAVILLSFLSACTNRMPGYFSVCNSPKVECRQ